MNLLTIKKPSSCGLFNLTFPARKEQLPGFNAERDCVIFIDSGLDTTICELTKTKTFFHKLLLPLNISHLPT